MPLDVDQVVLKTVSQVLGTTQLSPADDFFAIGGTSLSAAVVTTKLERALGLDISLRLLMENPVLGAFSQALLELGAARQT